METLEELEVLYKRACEAYAIGEDIMTDPEFDYLEKQIISMGSVLPSLVFEDVAYLEDLSPEVDHEDLIETASYSIRALKDWREVEEWARDYEGYELIASLKEDGVCAKMSINRNSLYAQSRNRKDRNPIDYTKALGKIVSLPNIDETISVTGECYVLEDKLDYLKDKYKSDKFKMARTAATSMLRTPDKFDEEDFNFLRFTAFNTSKAFNTQKEKLDWLKSQGFQTPKYEVFTVDMTKDIKTQIEVKMNLVDTGMPADGVVLELNDKRVLPEIKGKYQSTQIALKLGKWEGVLSKGKVIGLENIPKKGNWGCVLLIEPLKMKDGSTQSRVNAYNLGIVRRNEIKIGSEINFVRVSNNMANLVYK